MAKYSQETSKKSNKDEELLAKAKKHYETCEEYYKTEYIRGSDDLDFLLGEQWEEGIKAKRQKEFRPCLTENRLLAFAHQVINDVRQSRPAIGVVPVDNKSDPETAKILRGMIRNIEVQSSADNVYDTAAWTALSSGYGWMRINTKYVDNNSFDQEIELLRVPDFKSVMIDPNSKTMDGSDADYGFISEDMTRDAFKNNYPDANDMVNTGGNIGWCTEDTVRVCEYFYKEYEEKTIYLLEDGSVVEEVPQGQEAIDSRTVRIPSVKWCKFTGDEILEKTDWLGQYIPLVPVYGEEVWQDNRRKCFSLISQAKDPQRRYNYWLTASTEIIALQPKAPFIGVAGQFATDGNKWANANNETYAYLQYDPVELPDGTFATVPPQRQNPPVGSPAMFQEMMAAADGIKSTLGMFNASLGQSGNETSGKAILARQAEGDNATFHFVDNLQSSIRQVGRILIDLIPKIYTGPRIVRIIGEDDSKLSVPINQASVRGEGGNRLPIEQPGQIPDAFYDINVGKYDVVATVGASYATKRQETANMLQAVLQAAPETFAVLGDIFFKNLDIAESDIIVERLRKLNPAMNDDEDPQAAQLQQAGQMIEGMQQQLAQMDAALNEKRQKDSAETAAEIQKTQAEIAKIEAETTKIQAEVAAAMAQTAGITPEAMQEIVNTIAQLEEQSRDTADAVEIILSAAEGQVPAQEIPEQGDQVTLPPEATAMMLGENPQ